MDNSDFKPDEYPSRIGWFRMRGVKDSLGLFDLNGTMFDWRNEVDESGYWKDPTEVDEDLLRIVKNSEEAEQPAEGETCIEVDYTDSRRNRA